MTRWPYPSSSSLNLKCHELTFPGGKNAVLQFFLNCIKQNKVSIHTILKNRLKYTFSITQG